MIPLLTRPALSHLEDVVATNTIVHTLQALAVHSPLTFTSIPSKQRIYLDSQQQFMAASQLFP